MSDRDYSENIQYPPGFVWHYIGIHDDCFWVQAYGGIEFFSSTLGQDTSYYSGHDLSLEYRPEALYTDNIIEPKPAFGTMWRSTKSPNLIYIYTQKGMRTMDCSIDGALQHSNCEPEDLDHHPNFVRVDKPTETR